jgi:hypothetical protein
MINIYKVKISRLGQRLIDIKSLNSIAEDYQVHRRTLRRQANFEYNVGCSEMQKERVPNIYIKDID